MNFPAATAEQLRRLPRAKLEELARLLTPRLPWRYIPHGPTPKQAGALLRPERELLYGGAAGGGKTDWLLMGALQYVEHPGYAALLLRRTYAELEKADGLIERSRAWLSGTDAKWNGGEMRWRFPSGALLDFGHLQHEQDMTRYQSAAYQYIGFDELSSFTELSYRYMFSRLRRGANAGLPLRMRGASNPGGIGHDWLKARFHLPQGGARDDEGEERPFIPARLADNPHLDQVAYRRALANLDPITRRQLEQGDWSARHAGALFKREWFPVVEALPTDLAESVRAWDLAATVPGDGTDPDWTAGVRMHRARDKTFYLSDVRRFRQRPSERDRAIAQVASQDGDKVRIILEQEPGSGGKAQVEYLARELAGYIVKGDRPTGDKAQRALPLAAQAGVGNVRLVRGEWVGPFLDELEAFTFEDAHAHDDQVDAAVAAFNYLSGRSRQRAASFDPRATFGG